MQNKPKQYQLYTSQTQVCHKKEKYEKVGDPLLSKEEAVAEALKMSVDQKWTGVSALPYNNAYDGKMVGCCYINYSKGERVFVMEQDVK